MRLEHEQRGGQLILRVAGEMDLSGAEAFRRRADELMERSAARRLVLSLRQVTFMDSTGLGAILGRLRRAQALGGSVALVSPPPPVRAVIEAAGLARLLPVYASEREALEGGEGGRVGAAG